MKKAWYKELSVYQIWPRSFCDGNGDGIGDLKGVLGKLDYIKSLGVDAIWFSPLYASPQKDFGYDISDYRAINPDYGTMEDFKAVLDGAHERGMKVIMDLVINHTSDQHEWFKKSAAGDPKYKDYYIWRPGKGKDGKRPPNNWMATFPGPGWQFNEERGEYYLHLFAVEQPDLNHDNPAVREEVKDIMRFWLGMGVDGFREDVITYISKREGLPNGFPIPIMRGQEHYSPGPNIHKYLLEYRKVAEEFGAVQIGEAPMMTPKNALKYITEGKDQQLDMMFQFQHMSADCIVVSYLPTGFKLRKLKRVFRRWQNKLYGIAWNTNYMENHDQPRVISRFGSEEMRTESGKAIATIYTFLSGTHFVYQGQEIGMLNYPFKSWDDIIDVASYCGKSMMEKTHLFSKKTIFRNCAYASRDNARTPVQWSAEEGAGFTTGTPWFHINPNYTEINAAAEEKDPNSLLNYYRKIIALRKEYKEAAIYGRYKEYLKGSGKLYVYEKIGEDGSRLFVVANMSGKKASAAKVRRIIPESAKRVAGTYDGSLADFMRPYEAHVFVVAPEK